MYTMQTTSTELRLTLLAKHDDRWTLQVGDAGVVTVNSATLFSRARFQRHCLRYVGVCTGHRTPADWHATLRRVITA